MRVTNPGFIYIILAIILCAIYYGLEMSSGGVDFTAKSIICSWSIISLFVMSIMLGISKAEEQGISSSKYTALMYGLSLGTLSLSSVIIFLSQ
jgi:hypothetical protein